MGRPAHPTKRTSVLIRFDEDVLAALDAETVGEPPIADRTTKLHAILRSALHMPKPKEPT